MTYKELKKGEIYSRNINGYGTPIIFLYEGNKDEDRHFISSNGIYQLGQCCTAYEYSSGFREATQEEKQKLKEKIRENAPKDYIKFFEGEIINDFQIY